MSCAEGVAFEGRTYYVGDRRVHKTWVGERIAGQGGTSYEGAYELRTYPVARVIVLKLSGSPDPRYDIAFIDGREINFAEIKKEFAETP